MGLHAGPADSFKPVPGFSASCKDIEVFLRAALADHNPDAMKADAVGFSRAIAVVAIRTAYTLSLLEEALAERAGSTRSHALREQARSALYARRLEHHSRPQEPAEIAAAKRAVADILKYSEITVAHLERAVRDGRAVPLLLLYRLLHDLLPLNRGSDRSLVELYEAKLAPLAGL